MRYFVIAISSILLLTACEPVISDAGCGIYGFNRINMPRPLPNNELGKWVANLDTGMTEGCF